MTYSTASRPTATADCPICGEIGPAHTHDVEAARRWCVRHAKDNPDCSAHLETSHVRVYRSEAVTDHG